jgi:hypothetical protein
MRRMLPIAMASVALLAAGCGSSRQTYFVGTDGTTVAMIQWSGLQTGHIRGTITADTLSGIAPGETVHEQTVPVTVSFHGKGVSFSGTGLFALGGPTFTGTLSGGTLRITAPDATGYLESALLQSGTPATYNSDLAQLRQHASRDNTAAKREQQPQQNTASVSTDQQQVSSDITTLQSDSQALSTDLSQMGTDVLQVRTDLGTLQSDAANGQGTSCDNVATVEGDAATVDSGGTTVQNDSTAVTDDIGTVQSDIAQLTSDVKVLEKAGGSMPGGPNPQTAVSQAQADITNAVTQANSYIDTVNGYLQQAHTTAANIAGTNCAGSA